MRDPTRGALRTRVLAVLLKPNPAPILICTAAAVAVVRASLITLSKFHVPTVVVKELDEALIPKLYRWKVHPVAGARPHWGPLAARYAGSLWCGLGGGVSDGGNEAAHSQGLKVWLLSGPWHIEARKVVGPQPSANLRRER